MIIKTSKYHGLIVKPVNRPSLFDISSHIHYDITIHHDNTYKAILYYDNSTKIT